MQKFIPFEDDWALFAHLRADQLVPFQPWLLGPKHSPSGGNASDEAADDGPAGDAANGFSRHRFPM